MHSARDDLEVVFQLSWETAVLVAVLLRGARAAVLAAPLLLVLVPVPVLVLVLVRALVLLLPLLVLLYWYYLYYQYY